MRRRYAASVSIETWDEDDEDTVIDLEAPLNSELVVEDTTEFEIESKDEDEAV